MANQCTKFEVSSFNHTGEILGGLRIYMDHVTITTPIQGQFVVTGLTDSYDQAVYQI